MKEVWQEIFKNAEVKCTLTAIAALLIVTILFYVLTK